MNTVGTTALCLRVRIFQEVPVILFKWMLASSRNGKASDKKAGRNLPGIYIEVSGMRVSVKAFTPGEHPPNQQNRFVVSEDHPAASVSSKGCSKKARLCETPFANHA